MKRSDITDLMILAVNKEKDGTLLYEKLMEITGAPFKVVAAAINRAMDRGYLQYGVSWRTAWNTNSGNYLLENSPKDIDFHKKIDANNESNRIKDIENERLWKIRQIELEKINPFLFHQRNSINNWIENMVWRGR